MSPALAGGNGENAWLGAVVSAYLGKDILRYYTLMLSHVSNKAKAYAIALFSTNSFVIRNTQTINIPREIPKDNGILLSTTRKISPLATYLRMQYVITKIVTFPRYSFRLKDEFIFIGWTQGKIIAVITKIGFRTHCRSLFTAKIT